MANEGEGLNVRQMLDIFSGTIAPLVLPRLPFGVSVKHRVDIPELHGHVKTSANHAPAVRREGDAIHAVTVSSQRADERTRCEVIDPDHCVECSASNERAVRRDRNASEALLAIKAVREVDLLRGVRLRVPDTQCLVRRARHDIPCVAGKIYGVDLLRVALEDVTDLPTREVPDLWRALARDSCASGL